MVQLLRLDWPFGNLDNRKIKRVDFGRCFLRPDPHGKPASIGADASVQPVLPLLPLSIFVHSTHFDFTSIGLAASSRLRRSASTATTAATAATHACQHLAPSRCLPSAASRVAIDDAERPSRRTAAIPRVHDHLTAE